MNSERVRIQKLVFGGQGLTELSSGKKAFVWGVLPGELVDIRIIKKRKDYVEAVAENIVEPSPERIMPSEENYLSTSPWQIMQYDAENKHKKEIISEIFGREHINLPDFKFIFIEHMFEYRNKMEFSFWGDDAGLHLALHRRGSHGKEIVNGSKLALPAVNNGAKAILSELNGYDARAGSLKTVIVRSSQSSKVASSLFVKTEDFPTLNLPDGIGGLNVWYSNPKSPASVMTKLLYSLGDDMVSDTLLGKDFVYNCDSFFQVNLPIFNEVLSTIKEYIIDGQAIDMYGGVGSIGVSVANAPTIIEINETATSMAKLNTKNTNARVINTSSERALEYIEPENILIVDPPRAGLHGLIAKRILENPPKQIVYLSCNPSTQARDITLLKEKYDISFFEGYNFFPRTPHIETLAILQRKTI